MVYFHLRFLCANDFLVYMRNFKEINRKPTVYSRFIYESANLWYFKLWLFDLSEFIVWNIQGLQHWVAKTHFFLSKVLFKTTSLWFLGETRGTSGTRSRTIHQVLSYGKLEVPAWFIVQRTLTLPIICIFFLYLLSYFLLGYKF